MQDWFIRWKHTRTECILNSLPQSPYQLLSLCHLQFWANSHPASKPWPVTRHPHVLFLPVFPSSFLSYYHHQPSNKILLPQETDSSTLVSSTIFYQLFSSQMTSAIKTYTFDFQLPSNCFWPWIMILLLHCNLRVK